MKKIPCLMNGVVIEKKRSLQEENKITKLNYLF